CRGVVLRRAVTILRSIETQPLTGRFVRFAGQSSPAFVCRICCCRDPRVMCSLSLGFRTNMVAKVLNWSLKALPDIVCLESRGTLVAKLKLNVLYVCIYVCIIC